jgi:hypothetical protein
MSRLTTHKNFVLNGDFGAWAAGVPSNFDVDQTATTVVRLQRSQQGLHLAGQKQFVMDETKGFAPNIPLRANPLTRGNDALRFRATSALTAGDFALRTPGIAAAHTGAPTGQRLPVEPSATSHFSFWMRGTPGNVVALNLIMQIGGTPSYFQGSQPQDGDDAWGGTVDNLTFVATAEWRQHVVEFQPLMYSGGLMDDQLMFEITNVSTGVFILDLDQLEYRMDTREDEGAV